jgi:NADPH2:quinone reductase
VEAAAIAHLDRTVAGGEFGIRPELPYVGGVEVAGVVVESDELAPGTRVMLRGGGLGLTRNGTWADYVVARTKHLSVLPEGMPAGLGATYFVPLTTAATALRVVGRLGAWPVEGVSAPDDETVLVAGAAGAVGSVAVQLALRAGATVIGLVADDAQAARVPAGCRAVVAGDAQAYERLAAERPLSLLVDTLGGPGLNERMSWVRPGGRAVSIGYVAGERVELDLPNWLLQDVALLPVNMIRRTEDARALAEELAPLLVSGELSLGVETFALHEAARVLDLVGAGRVAGRAVLVPGEGSEGD